VLPFFGSLSFLTTDKIALTLAPVKYSRPDKFSEFAEDVEPNAEDVRKDVGRKSKQIGNLYRMPCNLAAQLFHVALSPACEQGKEQTDNQQAATTSKTATTA
jgi:hypothetical protein